MLQAYLMVRAGVCVPASCPLACRPRPYVRDVCLNVVFGFFSIIFSLIYFYFVSENNVGGTNVKLEAAAAGSPAPQTRTYCDM